MTVTADSPFRGVCRISRDGFRALLERLAAPAVTAERDGGEYWDAIRQYDCDPLLIVSMFNHESNCGKNGVATQTRSWGNTRAPSFGAQPVGEVPGRTGTFPVFASWRDGCVSTVARLTDPGWVYAGRTTIREIFDHPSGQVWAPAGDLNDPAGYLRAVLDFMNQYADQERPMANRPTDIYGIPVVWIPAANGNWDNQRAGADLVIVHDIEGGAPGAIGRFTTAGEQASTQLVLDPDQGRIVQMVDLDAVAYGCGNYPYNQRATQFEMPGYYGKPYRADVLDYAAKTIAYLCNRDNVPLVKLSSEQVAAGQRGVCGHENIPNQSHIDPGPTFPWEQVMAAASALLNGSPAPQPDNACRYFSETQHKVCLGFRAFYESHPDALQLFGYPISEEFVRKSDGLTVQYFERARFEWHPGCGQPFDVELGLLGAEDIEAVKAEYPDAFAPVAQG